MADHPIIFSAVAMRSLLAGRKSQARLLATSPLRTCRPGDRLWVRESCTGGMIEAGTGREVSATIRKAGFVVFPDGWRQFRSGAGQAGPVPTGRTVEWSPAIHMPRWAARATLIVEAVRIERLQDISRADMIAEGQRPILGGAFWRWDSQIRGLWCDPRRAFAAMWNATHGTSGERWADDPEVVVLGFQPETQQLFPSHPPSSSSRFSSPT